ncbi:MAG: HAMP domain-containing sensor histidine kinase [Eubacteriales bacterium]|nr:HAMP domain-containing sensor histidine kinase [Eubacteriales bacterium]
MGTKITTLRTAFVKYLIMLIGGLGLSVVIPFLLFMLLASFGIVNYANQSEEYVKATAPVLATAPDFADVKKNMPVGCDYLLLDKSYNVLDTTLNESDRKAALRYAATGSKSKTDARQFMLITRKDELLVLQYYIGSRFINPWMDKHLPSPETILYLTIALNCVLVCAVLTLYFSQKLRKQLRPLFHATEEISSQNLDFEIGQSNIKEFDDVLRSFSAMRDNLKKSLEQQWTAEQVRKEQIAALAHDLKTPLTVIRGNIDLLDETILDDEQQNFIKYASLSAEQMEAYIRALIELSRASMADEIFFGQVPFLAFWEDLCGQIQSLCNLRSVDLQTSTDMLPEYVQGDRILIERAVMNIVSNALDFAPEKSVLRVSVKGAGELLEISITDSGPGFSQKALKHAKELFFMDDESRGSKQHFGMGLYIAAQIVEKHRGKMRIGNSAVTKGAEVTLSFPAVQ